MIDMHSKYGNIHTNRIFNALNYINNHVNSCINCMLSVVTHHVPTGSAVTRAKIDFLKCVSIKINLENLEKSRKIPKN